MNAGIQPLWIRLVLNVLAIFVFAAIAWVNLFRTHQVQRWVIERDRFKRIYQSPSFLWNIRIAGVGAGISVLILLYALIENLR